jgi:hypothetical protein
MSKKKDSSEARATFERFDDLLRTVVAVPKDEINKRKQEEKRKKAKKKD